MKLSQEKINTESAVLRGVPLAEEVLLAAARVEKLSILQGSIALSTDKILHVLTKLFCAK